MKSLIEVQIDSVRVSLTNQMRIIILKEMGGERYLPVWVGPYEAEAITIALQEVEVARPQTHDLLKNMLAHLNSKVTRVEIINVKDDVFYANIVIEVEQNIISIDARPSDAIALAIRCHVPIYVARQVMDLAGTQPANNLEKEPVNIDAEEDDATIKAADSNENESGLEIFEDFLQKLTDDDEPGKSNNTDDDNSDAPAPA